MGIKLIDEVLAAHTVRVFLGVQTLRGYHGCRLQASTDPMANNNLGDVVYIGYRIYRISLM